MNLLSIRNTALTAASLAALIQKKNYEKQGAVEKKGRVNLLTQTDLDSQDAIVSHIRKRHPSHAILAEENELGHHETLDGPIWIVDPLDGTSNFSKGLPYFGISIAFVDAGLPQVGVVVVPMLNEYFVAVKGQGAFKNEQPITISATTSLEEAVLVTGFPYDRRESTYTNLELFNHFEMHSLSTRRFGAAAVDMAYVACGRFDGFWEAKLGPWDVAAGTLLVNEAGGQVSDFSGTPIKNEFKKGEIVATNGHLHAVLVAETKKYAPIYP